MVFEENIICFGHMKHMKKKPNSQDECGVVERGGIIVCGRWDALRPQAVKKDGGGFHDYGYSARWARTNPVFTKTSNGRNAIGSV